MSTAAAALGARVGEEVKWQSKIYKAIVTPLYFVSFLLSLYLIDNQYRARRQNEAGERPWLHRLLYRQRPSPYVKVDTLQGPSPPQSEIAAHRLGSGTKSVDGVSESTKEAGDSWFYHSKQKELFKLEAADAFALRDSVLFALCFLTVSVGWVLWRTVVWLTA